MFNTALGKLEKSTGQSCDSTPSSRKKMVGLHDPMAQTNKCVLWKVAYI